MLTYQFKLKPTKLQARLIDQQLESHRQLYNKCLYTKKTAYEHDIKLSCFDLIKLLVPDFKGTSNYTSLQQTVRRLDKAYQSFFRKGGYPRFKGKHRFRTIDYGRIGDGCQFKPSGIYLQHVGIVRYSQHRKIEGTPKQISITKSDDGYYLNIACETLQPNNVADTYNAVGIDFGIINCVTTSDSTIIETVYHSKKYDKQIARLQRKKRYDALRKVYTKIRNQRKDFNHKLSRKLVDSYSVLCLEDLSVEDITSPHANINRKLYSIGINQLINFITYKAENAGKYVVKVNPAYTTQTCSQCRNRQKLSLQDRVYECDCGYTENRDVNAASNILRLGLESLFQAA